MEVARFPFTKVGAGHLGEIYRPYAEVFLLNEKRKEWLRARMVVDSGADYTLLPRRYAIALFIDVKRGCFVERSAGIGGSEKVYLCTGILIKIGRWQHRVPVGFLERDDIPPLLGRLHCLEALTVVFGNRTTILSVEGERKR